MALYALVDVQVGGKANGFIAANGAMPPMPVKAEKINYF